MFLNKKVPLMVGCLALAKALIVAGGLVCFAMGRVLANKVEDENNAFAQAISGWGPEPRPGFTMY